MKEIFKKEESDYRIELKKFQEKHKKQMFESCKVKWEEFITKVYKQCGFNKKEIAKIGEYTSLYSKNRKKELPLYFAILDQVLHFYITQEGGFLYVEHVDDKEVDIVLLNTFFCRINELLYEGDMSFRWHHNSVKKATQYCAELKPYKVR